MRPRWPRVKEHGVAVYRLREGIDPQRYFLLTGKKLSQTRISELIGDGLVEVTRENRLRVSSEGFPVLDAVVADLAA